MNLDPMWVSGFVDGEGTFYVGINRNATMTVGYQVLPEFVIVQHQRDIQLLFRLKRFFGHGVVRKNHDDRSELRIRKLDALHDIVVPFFETNSLQTQKKHDFLKFARIIKLMRQERHLTRDGLIDIVGIACQMNRGDKQKTLLLKQQLLDAAG